MSRINRDTAQVGWTIRAQIVGLPMKIGFPIEKKYDVGSFFARILVSNDSESGSD
jgi:hypothetical protein